MLKADSHLKLLLALILDIYKVFEHIDMLSMGMQYQPYTVIPTLLGSDFGAFQLLVEKHIVPKLRHIIALSHSETEKRMVMQLYCKGSLIAANEPTKNNSRSSARNFRILNSKGFPQKVKCEACTQLA
jgi:hypothetical protein